MSWRITYSKAFRPTEFLTTSGTIPRNKLLKTTARIELRDSDGTIVRLGAGAEFEIKNSVLGERPEYSGPVYISKKGGCGKIRTSCWMAAANPPSERPDVFVKPGDQPNTDEFYAISGDIVIYEFDEESKTFTVCTIHEGEKASITYDSKADKIRNRYKASIAPYSDVEYEYVLKAFIDNRNWT